MALKSYFEGFVLIGGKSSRMGEDKAFLKIGEKTFLEHAVENLKPICSRVKVVLNNAQTQHVEKLPNNIPHIFDVYENRGALGGIHAALVDCETKYAVILAVDLPFVTPQAIAKLADIAVSSNKFIAVVPRQTDGGLQPLCAVYHAHYCLPALENLLSENASAPVTDFLELIVPRLIDQSKLTIDQSRDIFFNVNHPTDFQAVK